MVTSPIRRRKSIAVPEHTKKLVKQKKRSHSIAPGDLLSPRSRARRVLQPRKSILKLPSYLPPGEGQDPTQDPAQAPGDDETKTRNMSFTTAFRGSGNTTNFTRQSIGRRVSFAPHAYVKLYDGKQQQQPGSSAEQSPSPSHSSSSSSSASEELPLVNDENAYPGSEAFKRPRDSLRPSSGGRPSNGEAAAEQSMDMSMDLDETALGPEAFLDRRQSTATDIMNAASGEHEPFLSDEEEFGFDEDDDDMEVTQTLQQHILRRRSMSLGLAQHKPLQPRRRSSMAPSGPLTQTHPPQPAPPPRVEPEQDLQRDADQASVAGGSEAGMTDAEETDATTTTSTQYSGMEFTVPLAKPLKKPKPPSAEILALHAVTHSGNEPYQAEPENISSEDDSQLYVRQPDGAIGGRPSAAAFSDMDLTDALRRLSHASASFGNRNRRGSPDDDENGGSFSNESTEDGLEDDGGFDDRTVNLTQLMRRKSLNMGGGIDREEEEDESEGDTVQGAVATAKTPSKTEIYRDPEPPQSPPRGHQVEPQVASSHMETDENADVPRGPFAPRLSASTAHSVPLPAATSNASSARPITPASISQGRASAPTPTSIATSSRVRPGNAPSPFKPKPRFTAAFAPPVSRPSPGKRPAPDAPEGSANKKPFSFPEQKTAGSSASPAARTPGKLSPSKKAPFEARPTTNGGADKSANIGPSRQPFGLISERTSSDAQKRSSVVTSSDSPESKSSPAQFEPFVIPDILSPVREESPARDESFVSEESPRGLSPAEPMEGPSSIQVESSSESSGNKMPTSAQPEKTVTFAEGSGITTQARAPSPPHPLPFLASLGMRSPRKSFASPALRPSSIRPRPSGADIVDVTMGEEHGEDMRALDPTERWRMGVETADSLDEDEGPPISVEQFFAMTGIKFMDELTVPRRSTFHRMSIRPRIGRDSTSSNAIDPEADIPLAEYIVATVADLPQLEHYSRVAKDLEKWIDHSKVIYKEIEDECQKVTPLLFREYSTCDEEDQAELLQTLKLLKAHAHASAKSQWYDWKLQWVEQLHKTAEQGFSALESDAKTLETINNNAQNLLLELRREHEEVLRELELERADVADIENGDRELLQTLKESCDEQDAVIDIFKTDISEQDAKLERLNEALAELENEKRDMTGAIDSSRRVLQIQKNSTKAEVFKLKDEVEAIQDLHMWRPIKIESRRIEFVFAETLLVHIPCIESRPVHEKVDVQLIDGLSLSHKDHFPQLTLFALRIIHDRLVGTKEKLNLRQIVEIISDIWCAQVQILRQIAFVSLKYPVVVKDVTGQSDNVNGPQLKATITVLIPEKQAKVHIDYVFDAGSFCHWPASAGSLGHQVRVAYGSLDASRISEAVGARLAKVTLADNNGCILDASIDASEA